MNEDTFRDDQVIAEGKDRLAHVDDDGVTFQISSRWINA
jgi:hypothetical protein